MSTPQTIQNQFVNMVPQASPSKTQQAQDPTLPQTFTASTACVREKKNVATNVTIFSLCEQEEQIDDMLNCEEAERAFATLRKKMERDARQKKENSEITLITLFNNTYFACSIKVKKHFYAKHIYTIQTVGLLTIIYLAMLTIIYIAMLLFCY
jgi:polysaccharide pyruvyl transferase WcaK-like protein